MRRDDILYIPKGIACHDINSSILCQKTAYRSSLERNKFKTKWRILRVPDNTNFGSLVVEMSQCIVFIITSNEPCKETAE